MIAVATSANTPPTRPSIVRTNGPPVGAGTSMTRVDWMAAAIANAALPEMSRATASVRARAPAYCHSPSPKAMRRSSASAMPSDIARTVSSTRTGRASRTNPSALIATIGARIGCW